MKIYTIKRIYRDTNSMVEYSAFNRLVLGSSPRYPKKLNYDHILLLMILTMSPVPPGINFPKITFSFKPFKKSILFSKAA